jgi:hypothetical protein
MRNLLVIALAASLLSACNPIGRFAPGPSATPPPLPTPTLFSPFAPTPTTLPQGTRTIIRSASLSLTANDPVRAISQVEQAVLDAGGFVVSASSWSSPGSPGSSSLSARVPPDSLPKVRLDALELASQLQSDSTYSQDVTSEFRQLQQRLQAVALAENDVWRLLIQTTDPQLAISLTLARDLLVLERTNIERQLADYQDRAMLASFDVTFNAPTELISIE